MFIDYLHTYDVVLKICITNEVFECVVDIFRSNKIIIMVISCRFYEQKYPEVDEVVMVNVRWVTIVLRFYLDIID